MKICFTHFLFIVALLLSTQTFSQRQLPQYLLKIEGVVDIDTLENCSFFKEKYLVLFEQDINHKNPEAGKFNQRVIISHNGFDKPVTYICEGYEGTYALRKGFVDELSSIFNTNQILVEHRYFGESKPDSIDWQYLTTYNAATDHHKIYEALKPIYTKNWVSTGISKGGQTTMIYNMHYPLDMCASVPIVGPIARDVEDGRHEAFLKQVGNNKSRKKILNFQKELLKRKESILPLFKNIIKKSGYTYRLPIEEIYEYFVLEFSFAFWQWGIDPEKLPSKKDSDEKLLQFLIAVSTPDYFAIESGETMLPFFYQAASELGYYGYDTEPLKKYLSIESAEGYLHRIFLPEDMQVEFNPETYNKLIEYLNTYAHNTILIYGGYDPWSAAAPDVSKNTKIFKIIHPYGSHGTRIKNLPKEKYEFVIRQLNEWIYK
ncbi:MAG TPA: S28 family serine protease [Bacteroidales bacterium]|nr:S28 family serine protease [Bacteroidales bacterium]